MLEEYKELYRVTADALIPDWKTTSKNDLCRAYVANRGNEELQNAYYSAIVYKYWNLITKYYYMSANCASIEECYSWLIDSVSCCLNLASWENPEASIYKDPTGPDKVINRCMKCARLTYYQFINRKKRRDNFGLLSMEELFEQYGDAGTEPEDSEQTHDISSVVINDFVKNCFDKKDYFLSFFVDCVLTGDVFDFTKDKSGNYFQFNVRKISRMLVNIDEDYLYSFATRHQIDHEVVNKAASYVKGIPATSMNKKVQQTIENLKHSEFINILVRG